MLALLALGACTGDDPERSGQAATGCGADEQERLDPDYLVHVLPGGPEPAYLSDPPTSGPHAVAAARGGVDDEPLARPDQVGQLEAGVVLVQHGDLAPDDLAAVEALAGDQVLVLPGDDLPAPIVATAWTRKLVCSSLDGGGIEALQAFAEAHAGEFAGNPP